MFELLVLLVFPWAMTYAAASDLLSMTISNRVSLALVAGFAVMAVWAGLDIKTIGLHLSAGGAMLVVAFTMFALGWIGGGDAKLFAATALWLGWTHLLEYVVAVGIWGGLLTLAFILVRRQPLPEFAIRQSWVARLHDSHGGIPYGIALAAAGLMVYPHTGWMTSLL